MLKTLKFVVRHPLNRNKPLRSVARFIRWQIVSRLYPYPILYPWVNSSKILAWRGLTGVTGNIYCGLHEYEDMAFVLHFLRSGDHFVDAGANIGSYTILAATAGATVTSIEPLPDTFNILRRNIGVNLFTQDVVAFNIGLADQAGSLFFTNHLDTVNHVVPPGTANAQLVEVSTLDELCARRGCPALIKLDVEGYEREILKGGRATLKNPLLKALIVELNDSAARYGGTEGDIVQILQDASFTRMQYDPESRKLLPFEGVSRTGNGLFVRDTAFVSHRLTNSEKYHVHDVTL